LKDHIGSSRTTLVVAAFATLTISGGCEPGPTNLPTHRDLGGGPTAILIGALVDIGGCIFIVTDDAPQRWLVIWPSGFERRDQVIVNRGAPVASIGGKVALGGGEYHANRRDFVESLLVKGSSIGCAADDYWLATKVG
jgi:hypothetical protein